MMISPECYIEYEIKGKSKEHVLAEIRHLKRRIKELKKAIRNPNLHVIVHPRPSTELSVTKEYLKAAEEYLANNF